MITWTAPKSTHKKCSAATITKYLRDQDRFIQWLQNENIDVVAVSYTDLLDYIRHLQDNGKSKSAVSMQLCVLRHYLNYLISENKRTDNPATGLFIKGKVRKLPSGLLSYEEMALLYQQ